MRQPLFAILALAVAVRVWFIVRIIRQRRARKAQSAAQSAGKTDPGGPGAGPER
jgi:flagellar biogenesis protein FliO